MAEKERGSEWELGQALDREQELVQELVQEPGQELVQALELALDREPEQALARDMGLGRVAE